MVIKWLAMVAVEVTLLMEKREKQAVTELIKTRKIGKLNSAAAGALTLFHSIAFCAYKSPSTSSYCSC